LQAVVAVDLLSAVVVVQVVIVNLVLSHWLLEHPIRLLLAVAVLEEQVAIKEVMVLILFLALLLLLAAAGAVETRQKTAKMAVQVVALDAPVRETQMQ
jgi:hypothetical protein